MASGGGSLYALVDLGGDRVIMRLFDGSWTRVPWDESLGVPDLISTDGGGLTVLASTLLSETGGTPPDRIYRHAILTLNGDDWDLIAAMQLGLSGGGSRFFKDLALFEGAWYVAARFERNEATIRHGQGELYRSGGGVLALFASTDYYTCFTDLELCLPFPSFNALQVVGNSLYVGGRMNYFTFDGTTFVPVSHLVRITGNSVAAMATSPSNEVTGMFLENTNSNNPGLVVWGSFTSVGAVPHNRIARWNTFTNTWSALGSGLGQAPAAVVQIVGQSFNDIDYVAVGVAQAGGAPVNGVARWTGSAWENYGAGGAGALAGSMKAAVNFQGVTIGGSGLSVNGEARHGVARWNGASWAYVATQGTDGPGNVVARHNDEIYLAGSFTRIDSINANRIARRVDGSWQPLGTGMSGPVLAMISWNGELIAGGSFSTAGGVLVRNIAAWNGTSWRAIGDGFDDTVHALAVWNGELIAAGAFRYSDSVLVANVARWTGLAWEPIDEEFETSEILAVAPFADTLYIGGEDGLWRLQGPAFASVGNVVGGEVRTLFPLAGSPVRAYRRMARFNGTQWFPVASTTSSDFAFGSVESISGDLSSLLVTGEFMVETPSGTASNIALYDGTTWAELPIEAADAVVRSGVKVDAGAVVAGAFRGIGEVESFSFAQWSAVPRFLINPIDTEVCLDVADSVTFHVAVDAGVTPQYRWRRDSIELNDGLRVSGATTATLTVAGLSVEDSGVYDCVITNCAEVFSQGATLTVRGFGDPVCAGCPPCPADYDLDGGVTGSDIAAFFSDFEQGQVCADTDQDGGVTGGDIAAFFVAFEAGGC